MAFVTAEKQAEWREAVRVMVRAAKDVPCTDCGKRFPYYVMDFDHRDGEVKLYNVNKMVGRHGRGRILAEIAKCDVVCANCHRERTHARKVALLT